MAFLFLPALMKAGAMVGKAGAMAGKTAMAGAKAAAPVAKAGGQVLMGGVEESVPPLEGGVSSSGGFLKGLLKDRMIDASKMLVENALGRNPNNKNINMSGLPMSSPSVFPSQVAGLDASFQRPMAPMAGYEAPDWMRRRFY